MPSCLDKFRLVRLLAERLRDCKFLVAVLLEKCKSKKIFLIRLTSGLTSIVMFGVAN